MRKRSLMIMLSLLVVATQPAWAEPPKTKTACPICGRANDQQASYADKAGFTLLRGAANTAFGWTELLVQPTEEVKTNGNLVVGIGKGIGLAIKRTALGVGEMLTFWSPKGQEGYATLTSDCPICMGRVAHPAASQPSTASTR